MIRSISEDDYKELQRIHRLYYNNEFEFPDFVTNYLAAFTITSLDGSGIICTGGIRTIVECVAMTNKDYSARARRNALYDLLGACSFMTHRSGYDQMHCFVQDNGWMNQLSRVGFKNTKGQALVINV